jgi:predicted GNAT family N-acyltransferase
MTESTTFTVIDAIYTRDCALLRAVREPVFVVEQQVPLVLECDDIDSDCQHVLAFDAQQNPIGTGRLTPQHTIGRMAVLPDWRGHGVGAALLLHLISKARELGLPAVSLHAQISAIGFYSKHGFQAYGPVYQEAGIMHQSMSLTLTSDGN